MTTPSENPFANREEVFFIDYDGIVKNSNQFILHKIFNELFDSYKDFLHIEEFKGKDIHSCLTYASLLTERNPLNALKKVDFDTEKAYMDIYDYYPTMYSECTDLVFKRTIERTIDKSFCKKMYLYSRYKDKRIEQEIEKNFDTGKVVYCYGDIKEIINQVEEKITAFFITEYDTLFNIAYYRDMDFTEIYLADYAHNRFRNEDGDLVSYLTLNTPIFGDSVVKINSFTPVILNDDNIKNIIKK